MMRTSESLLEFFLFRSLRLIISFDFFDRANININYEYKNNKRENDLKKVFLPLTQSWENLRRRKKNPTDLFELPFTSPRSK